MTGTRSMLHEGERQKEAKGSDFRQSMRWLIAQTENATASVMEHRMHFTETNALRAANIDV